MSKDANINKRSASSPLKEDGFVKRACVEDSFLESDSETTIINPDFLTSTLLDSSELGTSSTFTSTPEMSAAGIGTGTGSVGEQLRAQLMDPVVLDFVSKAVAAQVNSEIRKEIAWLMVKMEEKDKEIQRLQEQVDGLEQYGRRNNIRISSIPETTGEDTDAIVQTVAKAAGVDIPEHAIDRSHRVGRPGTNRAVLVKFTSYRHKQAFMKARSNLKNVDGTKLFPNLKWPTHASQRSSEQPMLNKIFLNEDLTSTRADIAKRARLLKKNKSITDTWCRDGVIFMKKKNDTVLKITAPREMTALE